MHVNQNPYFSSLKINVSDASYRNINFRIHENNILKCVKNTSVFFLLIRNGGSGGVTHTEDSRRYWEEKRLLFLLGSTSILFFVCITPQLVLSLMIHEAVLESYSFQVTLHQ